MNFLTEGNRSGRARGIRVLLFLFIIGWLVTVTGCNLIPQSLTDNTTIAVNDLGVGIAQLDNTSSDWQQVMAQTRDKLVADGQSTIANEVDTELKRAVATTGAEVRCNVDFLRVRVQQSLMRLRASLLGQPVDPPEPALCDVVPLAVDVTLIPNRLNHLEFYGYDFDTTPIQVLLDNGSSTVDVSSKLAKPTHYHMTLNLGGNGVTFGPTSQSIRLRWNYKDISTISVIQPATPTCQSKIVSFTHVPMTFIPPHTRGDADFSGNGPKVDSSVVLANAGDHVNVKISMTAVETKSDWTTASGSTTTSFYAAEPGFRIEKVVDPATSSRSYTDTNHDVDVFGSSGGPVSSWQFVGDTGGDEAGTQTKVTVQFSPVRFLLTQTGNCVSAQALMVTQSKNLIDPQTIQRLNPSLRTIDPAILNLKPIQGQ